MPTLSQMHAEKPERTALIHAEYKSLAACAKEQAQLQDWSLGNFAVIAPVDGTASPIIRLYATYGNNPMFELTFQPSRTRHDTCGLPQFHERPKNAKRSLAYH